MQISKIQGTTLIDRTVVFTAADENYFNLYAKPLINSIKQHLIYPVHIHLYNPSEETKLWCLTNSVNFSYEIFDESLLEATFQRWQVPQIDANNIRKKNHMIKDPSDLTRLKQEIKKTYYACTRFIRLAELLTRPTYIIMLDTDSIVRSNFVLPDTDVDIHVFEKNHKKHVPYTQHLASTIFYTGTNPSFTLIKEHAELIRDQYNNDALYWFLDQDTLDVAIQKCNKKSLDRTLVDFNMDAASPIWCAKGPRKFKEIYQNEIKKYL